MSVRLIILMSVGAAVISAVALGCGSDSSSTAGSGSTGEASAAGSKAQFVKQANAACVKEREGSYERLAAARKKLQAEGLKGPLLLEEAVASVLLATVEAEIKAIEALEPPAGEEQEVEAIVASLQKTLNGAKAWAKSSGPEDREGSKTLATEITERFAGADRELHSYGLDSCAKG